MSATSVFTACIAVGLGLEAIALTSFGPGSFVGFVLVGLPLIGAGVGYFALRVVKLALRGGA